MDDLGKSFGWQYWQKTAYSSTGLGSLPEISIAPGEKFKTYPEAERIELPDPALANAPYDLWQTIKERRSHRRFSGEETMELSVLSKLLWAAQGVTRSRIDIPLRTAPSAGALYPIETYAVSSRVNGLSPGIYHFNIQDFCLEKAGDFPPNTDLSGIAMGQRFCSRAPLSIVFTAVFRRNMQKYGHRGLRYILLDTGHICQNLLLAATALGLKSCPVAAFFDDPLNDLLGIDGREESSLYLTAIG
ncbi:MAG: SagB/ThcOx family dehydrogenase [Thermodesulfobacteriota bacterium]